MWLFYPIAFPISKILDYLFGEEEDSGVMARDELVAMITLNMSDDRNYFSPSIRTVGSMDTSASGKNKDRPNIKRQEVWRVFMLCHH